MHGLTLLIIAAMVLVLAYRFYGAFLAAKVLALNPDRPTPSHVHNDGRDYVPTNRWLLFGHHFAAISGAGPLIGPVLAAQFGYLPGFLWLLIGAVLAGSVHDMIVLFASIRHDGESLLGIARRELGPFAGWLASVAVLFLIIITMAGASISVVNALFESPWGVFAVGLTIPVSIFTGAYLKWLRPGCYGEATVIGLTLIIAAVVLGPVVQNSFLAPYLTFNRQQLSLIMPLYAFLAAGLPVWLLLLPRDYLSSYIKVGVMLLLGAGLAVANPVIQMPAVTSFAAGGGPIIPGKVWPFLFITISCGALSGYHAVISSGTTPKMVGSEADIRLIGYGAMLTECLVAVTALVAATVLSPADYFAINTPAQVFAGMGMTVQDLPTISQLVNEDLAGRPGGAVALAVGMAKLLSGIAGNTSLMNYWYHFAIVFQALFILTLIDAGTRAGRYLLQEIGGIVYQPLKNQNWLPGILLTSGLISLSWGYLLYGGTISSIWPLFGVTNQLLGSTALAIGTTMLIRAGKIKYIWTTLVPMVFLTVTAITAGCQNIIINYLPSHNYPLAGISLVMLIIAALIIASSVITWCKLAAGDASGFKRGLSS